MPRALMSAASSTVPSEGFGRRQFADRLLDFEGDARGQAVEAAGRDARFVERIEGVVVLLLEPLAGFRVELADTDAIEALRELG